MTTESKPEVLRLADDLRDLVKTLDVKLDPFEAMAEYVVNERYAGVTTDERSRAVS